MTNKMNVFLSILNFGNPCTSYEEIANYIGCSPMSILGYLPEFDVPLNKRIIRRNEGSSRRRKSNVSNINGIEFYANREVLESLRIGVKFKNKIIEIADVHALLSRLINLYSEYDNGDYTYDELIPEVKNLL